MKNLLIVAILLVGCLNLAIGQCPPSATKGVHVVQSKDNLYRISLAYGVSIGDICKWNNIKLDEVLPVCKPLRVSSPAKVVIPQVANIPDEFSAKSDAVSIAHYKAQGKKHTVRHGETVAGLAELYGFTEAKFRKLNALSGNQVLTAGSVVLTTECSCAVLNTDIYTAKTSPVTYHSGNHVTQPTVPNGHKSTYTPTPTAPIKNLSVRDNTVTAKGGSASAAPYMKQVEYTMVEEINLLRNNPTAYIKHVEKYRRDKKKSGYNVPDATVDELIAELRHTSKLSNLETTQCMYNATRNHGADIMRRGKSGHTGSDGSMPWERVKKSCPSFQDGNENLVGGPASVRDAVILLLIDHGISSRGHRKTLLNPHWTHVACYKMGQVGQMPNSWVQNFGQAKASNAHHSYNAHTSQPSPTYNTNHNTKPVIHQPKQLNIKQFKQKQFNQKGGTTAHKSNAAFMKSEENDMLSEINLLRSNPSAYIGHIIQYKERLERSGNSAPNEVIKELIAELKITKPLSTLKPSQCIYNAATSHAQDILRRGKSGHQGSDGSWPWDRVKRSCTSFQDGNENLVAGPNNVRDAVILLLIDNGISNRGHRRTLLNPNWTHAACYKMGQIGQMPNNWIQNFGQE